MKVAVIGCGFMGIVMSKALKEESIDFVCFERSSVIGGTWHYRKHVQYGCASTMSTTITINSKEMTALSDDPWPADCPLFLKHSSVLEKLMTYAKKYNLLRHVVCNKEVVSVKRAETYDTTGQWIVTVKDTNTGEETSEVYAGVMVCVGQFTVPSIPTYSGASDFQGRILHSQALRTFESFADKNVVVVGFGTSALDAAVEISRVAKQVYLSSRSQAWVLPRMNSHGIPTDYLFLRRIVFAVKSITNIRFFSWLGQKFVSDPKIHHNFYGIYPSCDIFARDPVFNDELGTKIASGSIILRKIIERYSSNGVLFEGDVQETPVEEVVFATGYKYDFSFLEDGVFPEENGKISLYKGMYPPHLKHATLAIPGFILPWGAGVLPAELQTRWAAHLFSGKGSLPSEEIMLKEIHERHEHNIRRYRALDKMSQRVDVIDYSDDIASEIGVKPNFWRMAIRDPRLFIACIFGPYLSYQYRLYGPHKWSGARNAILKANERMRIGACSQKPFEGRIISYSILLYLLLLLFVYLFFIIG